MILALSQSLQRKRKMQAPHAAEILPPVFAPDLRAPLGSDWAWRPRLDLAAGEHVSGLARSHRLSEDISLYHDGLHEEGAAQGLDLWREEGQIFGLCLTADGFAGSFLSLSCSLPQDAAQGLELRHLIRVDLEVTVRQPLSLFTRLNVKHGPNVEQLLREVKLAPLVTPAVVAVDFDLAYASINPKRTESMWLDLIIEAQPSCTLSLADLRLSRRPRAAL